MFAKAIERFPSLKLDSSNYSADLGETIKMNCKGTHLSLNDVVWQMYSKSDPESKKVIYFNGVTFETNRYQVFFSDVTNLSLSSLLIIRNVTPSDGLFVYECACNVYAACSVGEKIKTMANVIVNLNANKSMETSTSVAFISGEKVNQINPEGLNYYFNYI